MRGKRRGQELTNTASSVRDTSEKYVAGRNDSSGPGPFLEVGFVQLPQEAAVSVWTCSTDSEELFKKPGDEKRKTSPSLRANIAADRIMKLSAKKKHVVIWFNGYKVPKERLERSVSEKRLL